MQPALLVGNTELAILLADNVLLCQVNANVCIMPVHLERIAQRKTLFLICMSYVAQETKW